MKIEKLQNFEIAVVERKKYFRVFFSSCRFWRGNERLEFTARILGNLLPERVGVRSWNFSVSTLFSAQSSDRSEVSLLKILLTSVKTSSRSLEQKLERNWKNVQSRTNEERTRVSYILNDQIDSDIKTDKFRKIINIKYRKWFKVVNIIEDQIFSCVISLAC